MNWILIETQPRQREAALTAAEQRRSVAEKAHGCVRWLKSQGFSVIRVEPGAVGPRIVIRTSPLCKKLEGVVPGFFRVDGSEQRYSFAYRFGCEVRWYEQVDGSVQ